MINLSNFSSFNVKNRKTTFLSLSAKNNNFFYHQFHPKNQHHRDEANEVEMSSDNKYEDFKNIQKTPLSYSAAAAAAEKKATFERDLSMLLLRGCFHTQLH